MTSEEKDSHSGIVGPTGVILARMFLCRMLPGYLLLSRMLLEDVLLDEIVIGSTLLEPLDQDLGRADILVDADEEGFAN